MERANNFDGLRLLAAMAVLLTHNAMLLGRPFWLIPGGFDFGRLGVLVFFAISGFLVMASWRRDPDLGRFLSKRFLRIVPGLAVAVSVTFVVVACLGLLEFPGNRYSALNGSLWTIEYEVHCYLLLAALALWVRHPVIAAAALCVVAQVYWPEQPIAYFAPLFVIGAALHEYPALRRWSWALVGLGVAVLPYRAEVGISLIVAPAVVFIGARSWPGLRSAGRYGDLSYGVYIYAWPVQQIAVHYVGQDVGYFTLLAASLPVILLAALLSWRFVEAPALRRKPVSGQLSGCAAVGGV